MIRQGFEVGRDCGLDHANHGIPLVSIQGVAHVHKSLIPQPLQQRRGIEPGKITAVGLPPPLLVPQVLPPVRLARVLLRHVRAVLLLVQWV